MALAMCFTITIPVLATEDLDKQIIPDIPSAYSIKSKLEKISNIPVFITELKTKNEATDKIKVEAKAEIKDKIEKNAGNNANRMKIDATDYTVTEAIAPEIEMLIANRAFSNTFDEVAKLLDNGFNVEYINFYVNRDIFTEGLASTLANDLNDPAYWESAFNYLGVYNGYKFLYSESELAVEQKNFVPVKNIKPSFNWTTFGAKTMEGILTGIVDSKVKNFTSFYGTVQNIFGSYATPLNITYGAAADSQIQSRIRGVMYFRTVLIRDLDNRINGYAYYEWGSTNGARLQHIVEIKYPVSQRTDTTYNYLFDNNISGVKHIDTPGFSGSRTYLENVYNRYKNTIGYFPVTESLDVYSIITSMLN